MEDERKEQEEEMAVSKENEYEFGGPVGAALISVLLPLVSVLLNEVCALPSTCGQVDNEDGGGESAGRYTSQVRAIASAIWSASKFVWDIGGSLIAGKKEMTTEELIEASSCCSITALPLKIVTKLTSLTTNMDALLSFETATSFAKASAVIVGYLFVMLSLHVILPGREEEGVMLRNGKRLR